MSVVIRGLTIGLEPARDSGKLNQLGLTGVDYYRTVTRIDPWVIPTGLPDIINMYSVFGCVCRLKTGALWVNCYPIQALSFVFSTNCDYLILLDMPRYMIKKKYEISF